MRYLAIRFKIEYIDAVGDLITTGIEDSDLYKIFNGYLKYTDILDLVANDFGYDLTDFEIGTNQKKFLTNAPIIQYANGGDYGTLSFFTLSATMADDAYTVKFKYYNSSGVIQGTENVNRATLNGAFDNYNGDIGMELLYFGCFPANLRNWASTFKTLYNAGTLDGGYYTIQLLSNAFFEDPTTQTYTININCPSLKGFEPIRLCWLNQWGAWDYYTFNMKSSKTISTKGSTYQQIEGTWNQSTYQISGFKGGKKAFRVNATEKITMNTDFVNESESEWFEELINSPEVYILKGYDDVVETNSALNQYVTPVRLITSSYTKKTVANDKLMQYTFEVEKSKTLRTQAV